MVALPVDHSRSLTEGTSLSRPRDTQGRINPQMPATGREAPDGTGIDTDTTGGTYDLEERHSENDHGSDPRAA